MSNRDGSTSGDRSSAWSSERWRRLLLCTLLVVSLLTIADVERAEAGHTSCSTGEVCMWSGFSYTGCFNDLGFPNTDSQYSNDYGALWNNCPTLLMENAISSFNNRSRYWAVWYTGWRYSGSMFCAAPGASSTNLNNFNNLILGNPNNTFSSHNLFTTKPTGCKWTDTN